MKCPDCQTTLELWWSPSGNDLTGVLCPKCEKRWWYDRVARLYNNAVLEARTKVERIVRYLDFEANEVELEPPETLSFPDCERFCNCDKCKQSFTGGAP